jgi:hypothetical protein
VPRHQHPAAAEGKRQRKGKRGALFLCNLCLWLCYLCFWRMQAKAKGKRQQWPNSTAASSRQQAARQQGAWSMEHGAGSREQAGLYIANPEPSTQHPAPSTQQPAAAAGALRAQGQPLLLTTATLASFAFALPFAFCCCWLALYGLPAASCSQKQRRSQKQRLRSGQKAAGS